MQQEKHSTKLVLEVILLLFTLFIILQYIMQNYTVFKFVYSSKYAMGFKVFYPIYKTGILLRFIFLVLLFLFSWFTPSIKLNKGMDEEDIKYWRISAIIFSLVFLIGYMKISIYDLYIFPVIFLITVILVAKAVATLRKGLNEENLLSGLNTNKEGNCVFEFDTDKGKLYIPRGEYHSMVDSGTGGGKSQSLIEPFIYQAALKGYAGIVYDFNGDPTKKDQPIQTKTVYTALQEAGDKVKTKFAFINFTDIRKTIRCNPIAPEKYIKNKLDIKNISTALMKNLESHWKEKTDFWANNAISYIQAVMYYFYKHKQEYCTLPHVISTCLYNHDAVFEFLSSDEEVCRTFKPMFSAWQLNAEGQTAGAVSSSQLPLTKLDSKEIYWVLSADEFDLDITNKERPVILCLGNAPSLKEAISPVLSVITLTCMNMMNNPDKQKSIFVFDELPTIVLYDLDQFISVVRKFNVCCLFAFQDFTQFVRDYGQHSAEIIRSAVGNYFVGRTGNLKTAEYFCNMMGTVKKIDTSYSESSESLSVSDRMQNEKVIQPRHIMGQAIGHFHGVMAGATPPFFAAQFKEFDKKDKKLEIPDFSLKVNTGDSELDRVTMENMVKLNYEKINNQIDELLKPFLPNKKK